MVLIYSRASFTQIHTDLHKNTHTPVLQKATLQGSNTVCCLPHKPAHTFVHTHTHNSTCTRNNPIDPDLISKRKKSSWVSCYCSRVLWRDPALAFECGHSGWIAIMPNTHSRTLHTHTQQTDHITDFKASYFCLHKERHLGEIWGVKQENKSCWIFSWLFKYTLQLSEMITSISRAS